jgi:uncharacterized protein YraI
MKPILRFIALAALIVALGAGWWLSAPPSATEARGVTWSASVWNNPDLAGGPVWTGPSSSVTYAWGLGAPIIGGATTTSAVDNFSVRFTSAVFFTTGNYRFTVQVNDGARLYVDGLLLINAWPGSNTLNTVQADYYFPSDGTHTITVEMRDTAGDATIIVSWAIAVGPLPTQTVFFSGVPWYGEFFNSLDMTGPVVFTTTYGPSGLNLNWGQGSPGGTVPVDNFSARFTRTLNVPTDLPAGTYTFYGRADDNFRFWVDVSLIMDFMGVYANDQNHTAQVTLLDGPHTLKFEYRELTVDASLFLTWTPPNAQNPVLPPEAGPPIAGGGAGGGGVPTGVMATVNISVLNFRAAPSLAAPILAKLSQGASYPVTGRTADGAWAQLLVNGVTGWSLAQYLTFSGDFSTVPVVDLGAAAPPPPPPPSGVKGMVMGNLRIREAPTTRSPKIGLMPWGTVVDILGKNAGFSWYMVSYGGITGWSFAPWIRIIEGTVAQLPYADGTQPEFEPPPATQGVVVQAFGNMRLRSGPGFQYPKIARVLWGSRVQLLARSTDGLWYKIQYGDFVGWSFATWYRAVLGDPITVPVSNQ